jgi:hypothetical protein
MMENSVVEAGWHVHYAVSETAGVRVFLVDFHGRRVLWDAALPYVVIDHQRAEVVPDEQVEAHGPWWSPLGARYLDGEPCVHRFPGGFEIVTDFHSGLGRYTQMWRFHADGRMAPWLTLHGPGLHEEHTYHPHWRFDFDVDGARDDAFEHWDEGRWVRALEEGWFPYTGETAPDGYVWRQVDFGSGASVQLRPHHWEDAEVFAVRYRAGERAPHTPHPAPGAQPYPAAYVGNEPLDGQDITLWYVAHIHHDQGFPFTSGPWIKVEGL